MLQPKRTNYRKAHKGRIHGNAPGGATLDEIVRAVNEVGAAPGDLIAILEALKQAGALSAELEVI